MPKVINTNVIERAQTASGVPAHGQTFVIKDIGFVSSELLLSECFVEMGKVKRTDDATKYLWTKALATCHAVCVYGFNTTGKKGMALSHCDGNVGDTIKALRAEMRKAGLTGFAVYVIGGQPQSSEKEIAPLLDKLEQYDICLIRSPTTTNENDGINLVMTWAGILFAYGGRVEPTTENWRRRQSQIKSPADLWPSSEEDS